MTSKRNADVNVNVNLNVSLYVNLNIDPQSPPGYDPGATVAQSWRFRCEQVAYLISTS